MILIMNHRGRVRLAAAIAALVIATGCGASNERVAAPSDSTEASVRFDIVVTHALIGAEVVELVGDAASVTVLVPNGADPHEWSPSAKDVERVMSADLVVRNGLGLETRLDSALTEAASHGVAVFTVADHVTVRHTSGDASPDVKGAGEHHGEAAADPHLWMDPLTMKQFIAPLAARLDELGIDVTGSVAGVEHSLDALDADLAAMLQAVPVDRRRLVTGHESLGYFADRYGYQVVGAVVPSLSSQAEASAGALADLVAVVKRERVPAIFTESGTPKATVEAISQDAGVAVIELETNRLPTDATYRTFMLDLATLVSTALR